MSDCKQLWKRQNCLLLLFVGLNLVTGNAYTDPSNNQCNTPSCIAIRNTIAKHKNHSKPNTDYREQYASASGRQKGIVYKLEPFWAQYDDFDIARRIFDGDFNGLKDTLEFKALFSGLAVSYSKKCSEYVRNWQTYEKKSLDYDRTSWNLDGSKTIHKSEHTKTYNIDKRFTPQWAIYDTDLAKEVLKRGVFSSFGLVLGYRGEMEHFVKNQGCQSAAVAQMIENFIRAANNRPSAQADGTHFSGAERESDKPEDQMRILINLNSDSGRT